ncbi:ATP-binding cassette subfamily C protein [Sporomusa sp. KB1]|jgi:ATP-binding cassette subfamily C protein|nr:ATP-binding cassette subfamily C protein [Sporomusa sp. KB1]
MNTLLAYIQELYAFSRRKLLVNLALMVFLGLIEGGGVFLLIPLLGLAGLLILERLEARIPWL